MCPQMSMNLCQSSTQPSSVTGIALSLMHLYRTPFDFKKGEFLSLEIPTKWLVTLSQSKQKPKVIAKTLRQTYTLPKGNESHPYKKGSVIRLDNYSTVPGRIPSKLAMGLASDITGGVRIDLDITATLLEEDFCFKIWKFIVSSTCVLLFKEIRRLAIWHLM